jgi:hypothetical protein
MPAKMLTVPKYQRIETFKKTTLDEVQQPKYEPANIGYQWNIGHNLIFVPDFCMYGQQ